eukprot:scaffold28665_cov73-Skeletonema_marinoi.AAC.1
MKRFRPVPAVNICESHWQEGRAVMIQRTQAHVLTYPPAQISDDEKMPLRWMQQAVTMPNEE